MYEGHELSREYARIQYFVGSIEIYGEFVGSRTHPNRQLDASVLALARTRARCHHIILNSEEDEDSGICGYFTLARARARIEGRGRDFNCARALRPAQLSAAYSTIHTTELIDLNATMSATVTETKSTTLMPSLETNSQIQYGDWRDDFFKQGYYVFKNAVSADKATNYYYEKALSWLESFENDFDLKNPETWTKDNLPQSFKNMYLGYCAAHEKFMWDART